MNNKFKNRSHSNQLSKQNFLTHLRAVSSVRHDHAAAQMGLQHVVQRHLQGLARGALDGLEGLECQKKRRNL